MTLRSLAPEASASANSATPAYKFRDILAEQIILYHTFYSLSSTFFILLNILKFPLKNGKKGGKIYFVCNGTFALTKRGIVSSVMCGQPLPDKTVSYTFIEKGKGKMDKNKKKLSFLNGLNDGIPIALGYLSVSFTFGITAVNMGIPPITAILISLTNVTSAGQVAGIGIIAAHGGLAEMAAAQLIINLRYALMSLSLSQKLDKKYTLFHRITTSFCITDEVFAVASGQNGEIPPRYMYGLMLLPYVFWSGGTAIGAFLGSVLPESVKSALGIAIYGMFIAIIIPPAKKSAGVLFTILFSAALSCCLANFKFISSGISIIICTVIAAVMAALLFPRKEAASDE